MRGSRKKGGKKYCLNLGKLRCALIRIFWQPSRRKKLMRSHCFLIDLHRGIGGLKWRQGSKVLGKSNEGGSGLYYKSLIRSPG